MVFFYTIITMSELKIKFNVSILSVVLIALAFFVATSAYNFITQQDGVIKWNSPDETANYYFANNYASGEDLLKFDHASAVANDLVIPRSLRSDHGWLKPVSFLGIILIYGKIGSLTSPLVIPYLTPFFGALGIIFFYFLIRRLFSPRIALISAALLAVFPVYLYYSIRSMFHNVLFLVLLIIAFYFIVRALDKKYLHQVKLKIFSFSLPKNVLSGWFFIFIGGFFIGLAIITRSSELLWLLPVLAILILCYAKRLGSLRILLFLSGIGLGLLPALYYNQILYQSPFYGGYGEMNRTLTDISLAGSEMIKSTFGSQIASYGESINKIFKNIFFFGFHPGQSKEMFGHYVVKMFPWLTYLAGVGVLGLIILNITKPKKKYFVYLLIWVVLSVILVLYYGSWRFTDNPNAGSHTIGNSYTRYWLPMYLMALPLVALAIELFLKLLFFLFRKTSAYRALISGGATVIVFLISLYSFNFLLFGSEEGIFNLYYNTQEDKRLGRVVLENTPPEAVVMTQYHDKVLFPERRIIMGRLEEEQYYPYLGRILDYYPVYYFNFKYDQATVDYLNNGRLAKSGLKMELVKKVSGQFSLYKISKIENKDEK